MSTKDLVNAIIVGDAVEIENAFQATMAEKISSRLDDYRQEVAQSMFKTEEVELEENYVIYNHDGKYNKIKKVVKNHATAQKHAEKLGGDHKVASMEYWQDRLAPKTNEEAEQILASEEFAQLDELSKTTLSNYVKKATSDYAANRMKMTAQGDKEAEKRRAGVKAAKQKLSTEDVEQLVVTTVESALYAMQDGRNVLDEQIDEAVSSSSKDNYEWTHGNKPKGHGNWFFSTVHPRQHDMQQHKDQTVNVTGTFGDAAKKAQAHFKEKGHKGEIHVLT